MASQPRTLRVPRTANARVLAEPFPVQVNHCRTPGCANFGVPARTKHGKTGPSADRDFRYKLTSTAKGQEPAIECKECRGKGAVRSNTAIAQEIGRIADYARPLEHRFACKTEGCANRGLSIGEHRHLYVRRGYRETLGHRIYQCKGCLRRVNVSVKVPRIRAKNQALAADVFSRIANKSPMRRTVKGAGLTGNSAYYRILDFIHRRCREMNGSVTRAFLTGERRLAAEMNIALDSQSLMVNWPSKVQRRTVEMTSCCSVDSASRFILELDVNHDPRFDAFDVNYESAELGDMTRKEAFRKYARFWLAGDEMRSGRTGQRRMGRAGRRAGCRRHPGRLPGCPQLCRRRRDGDRAGSGAVARHHAALRHAGEDRLPDARAHVCAARDPEGRRRGAAPALHGRAPFDDLVLHVRLPGADRRGAVRTGSWCALTRTARSTSATGSTWNPGSRCGASPGPAGLDGLDRQELGFEMIRTALEADGLPEDGWLSHPVPTRQEPDKAVRWITERPDMELDDRARLYLAASLGRVDNVFQLTRRFLSALERPFYTPSGGWNQVWYGYAPYNPDMVHKYLDIFRAVNNFIHIGADGATPAMRLGFADRPLAYADLLWPGERIPAPKKVRRKGRALRL